MQPIKLGEKTESGRSLMHFAARDDRQKIRDWLKCRGEDVNAEDNDKNTPIFEAAATDHEEIIGWFVTQGADVK